MLIGPTPPPYLGVAVMTGHLKDALEAAGCDVTHVNTANHRGIQKIGRLDWRNTRKILRELWHVGVALAGPHRGPVIVPIGLSYRALLRDCAYLLAAAARGRPTVIQLHGSAIAAVYRAAPFPLRWLIKAAHDRATGVIVLSEALKSMYAGWVPSEKLWVLPNGVEDSFKRFLMRSPRDFSHVLHLGTLSREKGTLVLIEAADILKRVGWKGKITMAGTFLREAELSWAKEFIARQGLGDMIFFAGEADAQRKMALFAAHDIFVFTPLAREGQPLVLLEALAAGLPIITNDSGGAAETVQGSGGATLLGAPAPEEIASAILRLDQNATLRGEMGRASREWFEARYTLARFRIRVAEWVVQEKLSVP